MTKVHPDCDNAGKQVRCDRCGREYVCTPWDDFYCTPEGDHCCEQCLIGDLPLHVIPAGEIQPAAGGEPS